MKLSEKLQHLRTVEGEMRGFGRALTKAEVARLMRAELDDGLSEAYLSQLESGRRRHLTAPTRGLLARFFKVHPGYLVDDPTGYETTIMTQALHPRGGLRDWLLDRASDLHDDPALYHLFLRLARSPSPRDALLLLDGLLDEVPERPAPLGDPVAG